MSREAGLYFVGNTDSSTLIRFNQQTTGFIVVEFTPHGACPIFGIPLQETAQLAEIHNNLVYPLLRRFIENGWVSKRSAAGERGQTRDVYTLTPKGKHELLRRLSIFTEKEAASEGEFNLRVGMFFALDRGARDLVLRERDRWLSAREERLTKLADNIDVGVWGGKVLRFLRERTKAERKWIAGLVRSMKREGAGKRRA